MKLNELTISEASEGLQEKRFSSLELVEACLKTIRERNSKLNAFLTVTDDVAKAQARESDERRAKSESRGSLDGIPYSLKDAFCAKGVETTAGSRILEPFIAPYNATVVERLNEAGAVLLGKTNMDSFGHGSSTENSAYGITKNPHDPSRVAGGSSGGAAASVAAHMAIFSIAEDTGGSIRQPAAFCGVYGLKPTYGAVSRYGCIAYASSLDTVGVIGKSAGDIGTVFEAIAGPDGYDATAIELKEARGKTSEVKTSETSEVKERATFIVPEEFLAEGLDKSIKRAIDDCRAKLRKIGWTEKVIQMPNIEYAIPTYYLLAMSETSSNLARYDGIKYGLSADAASLKEVYLKTRAEGFTEETKRRIILGTFSLSSGYIDQYYKKAAVVRESIAADFEAVFEEVDFILSPVSPIPPWKPGELGDDPLKMYLADIYTVTANLAGVPALAFPASPPAGGLPIGLQLIGPSSSDFRLIEAVQTLTINR